MIKLGTVQMAEFFTVGGFDVRYFLISQNMFWLEEEKAFHNEDCDFWYKPTNEGVTTTLYREFDTVSLNHNSPENLFEILEIFEKGWWSAYDGEGVGEEEKMDIINNYMKTLYHLIR